MNKILKLYLLLPSDDFLGLFSKALNRIVARLVKVTLDFYVPNYYRRTQKEGNRLLGNIDIKKEVIVSLTSFPARLGDVWIAIESLFRQSYKVDRIVLWLDNSIAESELPPSLKQQVNNGLELRFVEDLRAHTKYFYALSEFKENLVITVDDDCYYPKNTIKNLITMHKEFPEAIIANRMHGIVFNSDGKIAPYSEWRHNFKPRKGQDGLYLLTGVSGVLYPPGIFDERLFNKEVFMDICKFADDIWLTINAIINNISIKTNSEFNKDFISISKTGRFRLLNHNSKSGGNDEQLKAVLDYFELGNLETYREKNSS